MIRDHFTIRGYEVMTAGDGTEGLKALETYQPDLVLLDVKMKRLDGDQFLKEMRERKISAKVLVVTGFQDEVIRERIAKLGVDGFIEKPASIVELQRKVQELIGKADNLLRSKGLQ